MKKLWDKIRIALGLKRKPISQKTRERNNIKHTEGLIRNKTHPDLGNLGSGRLERTPAERKVYGMWCIRSPWHNGAWIGGYYNQTRDLAVTCANPANTNDYDDRVEQHEIAHRIEYKLRIAPPWHTPAWSQLFLNWRNIAAAPSGGEHELCDAVHLLPYCEDGDVVEVDVVLSQGDDKTK